MTSDAPAAISPAGIRVRGRGIRLTPHNCFACGSLNAHGLRLELHAEAGTCWTELALPERFEGWEGIAHGGIVATILDEVMAWALVDRDMWGVTARMQVEFRRPVRIGTPIRAEGRVVDARRRLVTTEARLEDLETGELLASATGTYVAAPETRKAELKRRYGYVEQDGPEAPTTGERAPGAGAGTAAAPLGPTS